MRFAPFITGLAAIAAAAPLAEEITSENVGVSRSILSPAEMAAPAEAQEVAASSAEVPKMDSTVNGVKILAKFKDTPAKDGAKRTTVKYGTWSVTSAKMMQSTKLAKGPCGVGGCLVTGMEATIRYPDGKEANSDTQAWMHHIAMFGAGAGQGSLWAAGNERPTLRLNEAAKYGLDFPNAFMLMVDLMTEDTKPKTLTLEITYEHVPKGSGGYKPAAMYWLSVGEPAAKDGVYKFTSSSSVSGYNAKLLYAIGHMHDGGTDMRLFVNGKMVCKSVMHYSTPKGKGGMEGMSHGAAGGGHSHGGEGAGSTKKAAPKASTGASTAKPAKKEQPEEEAEEEAAPAPAKAAKKASPAKSEMSGHSHGRRTVNDGHGGHGAQDMDMPHIIAPGACTAFGTVSKGERMYSEAWYDTKQHPLMVHNGKKENLMGNMRVYIGPN